MYRLAVRSVSLTSQVLPELLFHPEDGKVIMLGHRNFQRGMWDAGNRFWTGRDSVANFMIALPFMFPRSILPIIRDRAVKLHPELPQYFDALMMLRGKDFVYSQFIVIGDTYWHENKSAVCVCCCDLMR